MKKIGNFKYGIGYLLGQTYLNLFFATIFSMIICAAFKFLFGDNFYSFLLMGVVSLFLNGSMVYFFMWRQGDKEANYIQHNHIEKQPLKGLKVGLLAMIPYLLMDILLALSVFKVIPFNFLRTFRILNAPLYGFMKLVHSGIDELSAGGFIALALMPFIYVIFSALGYELGLRHISIKNKLVYKE